jgi:uncharacterized cupin superfamily protein
MANIHDPIWDELRDHPGFVAKRSRLGRQAGTVKTGVSLWEVAPGEAAYPYHWHMVEEEIVVILEGTPALRTPDGWRTLEKGEVVAFVVGEEGAHQILNDTDRTVRFLSFSNQHAEVCVYPDSGKIGAYGREPDGSGMRLLFREADAVDYHDGEEPPTRP